MENKNKNYLRITIVLGLIILTSIAISYVTLRAISFPSKDQVDATPLVLNSKTFDKIINPSVSTETPSDTNKEIGRANPFAKYK